MWGFLEALARLLDSVIDKFIKTPKQSAVNKLADELIDQDDRAEQRAKRKAARDADADPPGIKP